MPVDLTDLTCAECGFDASRWSTSDFERTLAHADDLARDVTNGLTPDQLAHVSPAKSHVVSSDPIASVHAVMHHLMDLARLRRQIEVFEPMSGVVAGLYASGGGVPKRAISEAVVGVDGVKGDTQGHRVHHGRPWQALCLYSTEVIAALQAEGHTIVAGSVGENITVEGVDWRRMRGGLTIEIGDVRCRVSAPADPCYQIEGFFEGDNFGRISHRKHPGWSRWYASVMSGGVVRPGGTVVVSA
jgi:MOSC domain-containing protein YiiM